MSKPTDINELENMVESSDIKIIVIRNKEMILSVQFPSGYTISGRCACNNPEQFDLNVGYELAKQDVIRQLQKVEAYRIAWEENKPKNLKLEKIKKNIFNTIKETGEYQIVGGVLEIHSESEYRLFEVKVKSLDGIGNIFDLDFAIDEDGNVADWGVYL